MSSQLELGTSRMRKLGEPRIDSVAQDLDEAQVAEQSAVASALRDKQDALKDEKARIMAKFKARLTELVESEKICRRQVATRRRDIEILVQDYLLPSNEVVSIRVDTNDVVNRRTATPEELQEDLFGSDDSGFGGHPQ